MRLDPTEPISLEDARKGLSAGEFAFVDAGCSAGGSLSYCERVFRKGPGLGFDISPDKIARACQAGHRVCQADLATVDLPRRSVLFVSLLDFLEHLPDLARTRDILANMARVARDFLFIRHPNFEDIAYLKTLGFKLDWTDWHGHTNMMTLGDFVQLMRELELPAPTIIAQKPIADSTHPSIVPLSAPRDTVRYDPVLHGPKQTIPFDRPIYSQFDIFVRLDDSITSSTWDRITSHVVEGRSSVKLVVGDEVEPARRR